MTAWAVTTDRPGDGPVTHRRWRDLHHAPFPDTPGLLARRISAGPRGLSTRYLFDSAAAAADFARRRAAGPPRQIDPAGLGDPVLVVSAPRSGSTALFDALGRHPGTRSLGAESEGVLEGVPALHPATRDYRTHRLTAADAARDASATTTVTAGQAVRTGFLADLPGGGAQRLVEKTPENALRLPLLLQILPDATIVYLRRDPRDTVASMVRAWQHPGFVNIPALPGWTRRAWHLLLPEGWRGLDRAGLTRIAAYQWEAATEAILDGRSLVPAGRWLDVEYEELRRAGPQTVARLYAALGLAPHSLPDLPLSATTVMPPRPRRRRSPSLADRAVDHLLAPTVQRLSREEPIVPLPAAPAHRRIRFVCWLGDVSDSGPDPGPGAVVAPTVVLQAGESMPLSLTRRARYRERFLPGCPILWVEDGVTGALDPYWLRPEEFWTLRTLIPGQSPAADLPTPLRRRLRNAGILNDLAGPAGPADPAPRGNEAAQAEFSRYDLCRLARLLSDTHRRALNHYYEELIDTGSWPLGDDQVAGRYGWHNEPLSRFFHHQLTSHIGRLVGEPVRPSYSYVSAYRAGATLNRHVDREQCEFTVSVLLAESGPGVAGGWPLLFDTPAGTVSLTQQPGEAVLFRGTRLPHYRPPLPDGNTHTSLLLHYVPAGFRRTLY